MLQNRHPGFKQDARRKRSCPTRPPSRAATVGCVTFHSSTPCGRLPMTRDDVSACGSAMLAIVGLAMLSRLARLPPALDGFPFGQYPPVGSGARVEHHPGRRCVTFRSARRPQCAAGVRLRDVQGLPDHSDVVSVAAHERLLLRGRAVEQKTVLKQQVDPPFAKLIGLLRAYLRHYDSKISCSAAYGDRSPDERPRRRRAQAIFSPEWTTGQRNRVICKVSPQFHALVEDVDRALREEVDLLED